MALEYCDSLPERSGLGRRGRTPYPAKEIEAFLASEKEQRYAKVTIEGKKPKSMNQSFRLYLKKNPEIAQKVAVHLIGGELYLERLQ